MLKLKKLQILGFKSFCDRTELQFSGTGVVGIVGPNGCGKSNIADAISWVLGEQSAKSLRGGRMEDVIFAGTRDRMATGMAEVSLTLIDPAEYEPTTEAEPESAEGEAAAEAAAGDGWDEDASEAEGESEAETSAAPAGEHGVVLTFRKRRKFRAHNRRGEVVVTRRLFRNGESEYLMNGRPCRLRDIQDLFMGTGLGPESYAIIEQGRIGQILSSKPHERRAIIEEAAGVSKYKAKRRLAEIKLEHARQNLARINDIFEEVTRQVASLKRQASKAERYRELKTEFDLRQRRWLGARGEALVQAVGVARAAQEAAQAAVEEAHAALEACELERGAAQAEAARLEQELRQATAEAARLQRDRDHTGQQIGFQRQQGAELEQRAAELREQHARADEQAAALGTELAQAVGDRDAAGVVVAAAREAMETRRQAHATAQAAVATLAGELDSARRETLALMTRTAALGQEITQCEALRGELARQLERWSGEEAAAHTELEAGGARRGQLALEFQGQEEEKQALAARQQALQELSVRLSADLAAARAAAQAARTSAAEIAARRTSLDEVVAQHGYSSEAVQRLFAQPEGFVPQGVLGEYLEVEPPYDRVVEQFLHEELNYVVVENWDQAGAGVGLLRAHEQGRATFLVHGGEVHGGEAAPAPPELAQAGVVALLGQVRAVNGLRHAVGDILPRLRQAYFVEDAAAAPRLAAAHPEACFLTAQGECYHNYTVSGGSGVSRGPLSLKRELRELHTRHAEAEGVATAHETRAGELALDLEGAQRELEAARTRLHELDKRLLTSRQATQQVEQELHRAQTRLAQAQTEGERVRAAQHKVGERLATAREEMERVAADQSRSQEREQELAQAVSSASAGREAAAQALAEAQAELARVDERARSAAAACDRLHRLRQELVARLAQMAQEMAAIAVRRGELELATTLAIERVAALEAALTAAVEAQAAQDAGLLAARAAASEREAMVKAAHAGLDQRRQALADVDVALARLDADAEHLRETCRQDLDCELEALLAEAAAQAGESAEPADLVALETGVRELRQKIENLGPVNMMALEEFQEAQQRHVFMETQRTDLLDSIADTQKAIVEMDTISREKFQEAFERINANFQETFQVLFGGGQGFLRLSEVEGDNEQGVDLIAQPPGKKLQNALLLSGGEKAMTAMALLIAVFRYQPSPFCLLDEVDAPMDEANVARFSNLVEQMSDNTQFILITHNKRTMEAAPTLYGVTMAQAGVSRLVSVRVQEVDEERRARRAAAGD